MGTLSASLLYSGCISREPRISVGLCRCIPLVCQGCQDFGCSSFTVVMLLFCRFYGGDVGFGSFGFTCH